jgi:two-component sensor histidine kinase
MLLCDDQPHYSSNFDRCLFMGKLNTSYQINHTVKTKFLICFLCLFSTFKVFGQNTLGGLEVPAEDVTLLNKYVKNLDRATTDTEKVKLCLKLSRIYWYKNTIGAKDSSIYYAQMAYDISPSANMSVSRKEALFLICKAMAEKNNVAGADNLIASVSGEERARLMLVMGEHFVFSNHKSIYQQEKGLPYIFQEIILSKNIKSEKWKHEGLMLLGKYYFSQGDFNKGKKNIFEIISDYKTTGNSKMEAHYWSELGLYMPETDSTYKEKIFCHQAAFSIYYQIKLYKEAAYTLRDIAVLNKNHNNLDTAESQILKMLAILKSVNIRPSFTTYRIAGDISRIKGDYNKALSYILEALNTPEILLDRKMNGYETLADIYSELGLPQKSLYYYRLVLNYAVSSDKPGIFLLCYEVVREQINSGDAKNALQFLIQFTVKHPPILTIQKELLAGAYGDAYSAINQFYNAEKYYLKMVSLDRVVQKELKKEIGDHSSISGSEAYFTITGSEAYYNIGRFYTTFKRYKDAKPYLQQSLTLSPNLPSVKRIKDIEFLLFKVDSASGNYLSAINHFEKHKNLNDSIFNATKSKQLTELQLKYESAQNAQSIRLLKIKSQSQQTEIQKVNMQRNITFGGVGMLMVIAGITFYSYKNKQHTNLMLQFKQSQLESKQTEINDKNIWLQNLLHDKDRLITEKDWLLKEVHHRVKNNLQVVISLLNTQSNFLSQGPIFNALRESQNRVQAIALIHQKLYGSSMTTSIEMHIYITELVSYLKACFDTRKRQISFELDIDPISMDVIQAIPIGLILNETITNSIKYAFTEQPGEIKIELSKKDEKNLLLTVADNGKGLPDLFDPKKANTMGMEMIKALSKQINGILLFSGNNGTIISIEFPDKN